MGSRDDARMRLGCTPVIRHHRIPAKPATAMMGACPGSISIARKDHASRAQAACTRAAGQPPGQHLPSGQLAPTVLIMAGPIVPRPAGH